MAKIEILIPAMGEGITEATITQFLKKKETWLKKKNRLSKLLPTKLTRKFQRLNRGKLQNSYSQKVMLPKLAM